MSARQCEACNRATTRYAMDTCSGGWGGYYCEQHTPKGWIVYDNG
jgi:hypothetical protein